MPQNYTKIDKLINKLKKSDAIGKPKEAEPLSGKKEKYEVREAIEHKPEEEVGAYVQTRAETIELPPDLKKMGLQPTSTTQFPSFQNIKLPISDDKIISALHQPVTTSIRWLATLAMYLLGQAHLVLKVVHGKVVRVIKS